MQGLVFGKFLPLHLGHRALIEFGLARCGELVVLVCASEKEDIPVETRKKWIQETFPEVRGLRVEGMVYDEEKLPNSSVASRNVSAVWAEVFSARYPELKRLFTSEPYGDFVGEFMGVEHILFDQGRDMVPVSGTEIREAPFAHWEYLPIAVRPWFQRKVVLLGTESTGKTTLTRRLAEYFGMGCVEEAAREVVEYSEKVVWEDLERIVEAHASAIRRVASEGHKLVFVDTDCATTQSYARYLFGRELEVGVADAAVNQADLYLYLGADAPFVQDGTRLAAGRRLELDEAHQALFKEMGRKMVFLNGSWDERFDGAVKEVNKLFSPVIYPKKGS